ncbi:hypothetical protein KM472_gp173 [Cynomolgus macaque cytomegalovirus strain Ottawa]|uniref:Uncharacterized protein n=1 Tax=macacine betaherpesvirus 8 TaxID=2560567 RepID=G8H0Q2_9BETA|nr:hypothetical protein KM472_gp173 [Cynomolgus macaque cytomegalovirus strain Ottawa]AEQ32250.1 hypothetical protein cy162 [Cynomolgus macaque cytomegalovirus strain Ottawa]
MFWWRRPSRRSSRSPLLWITTFLSMGLILRLSLPGIHGYRCLLEYEKETKYLLHLPLPGGPSYIYTIIISLPHRDFFIIINNKGEWD